MDALSNKMAITDGHFTEMISGDFQQFFWFRFRFARERRSFVFCVSFVGQDSGALRLCKVQAT